MIGKSHKNIYYSSLAIDSLAKDIYTPSLRTHKLSGVLLGAYACLCGYDCRIVFLLDKIEGEEVIVLVSVGTHDAVY